MGKSNPQISIVTPVRNGTRFLPSLVACLKAQTYQSWECLLVDHASTDDTWSLILSLVASDERFRCMRISPSAATAFRGPAMPRNTALDLIRGSLVCFLDVDDLWHPEKLERQLAFHQSSNLDISVTGYGRLSSDHTDWLTFRCPPPLLSRDRLLRGNAVPILTVMVDAKYFRSDYAGQQYRFQQLRHEDYLLWLLLWKNHPEVRYG